MSKLEELIKQLCPNGVEYKTLDEIANYRRGSFPQPYGQANWYGGEGAMPFVQVADVKETFELVDETKQTISVLAQPKSVFVPKGTVLVTLQGTIGRVAITQYDSYVDRTLAIFESFKIDKINKKYFAYQLKAKFDVEKEHARGSTLKTITKEEFSKFKIPVPPLEVQREIVHALDSFTLLTAELTAELTARKKQYDFYRDKLLTYNKEYPMKALADLGKWTGGKTPTMAEKSFWEDGTIPWISSKDMKASTLSDTQDHITEKAVKEASMTVYPANSIAVVTRSGILKHTFPVAYVPFETTVNQDIKMLVVNEDILPRYAFHVIQGKGRDILAKTKKQGGTVDSLDFQKVLAYKVPIPSIEEQKKLVEVLDNFEAICTDLNIGLPAEIEVRQKQYEYYRDLLLTFAETGSTLVTDRQTDRQS